MLDILLFIKGRHSTMAESNREIVVSKNEKGTAHEYDRITIYFCLIHNLD